MKSVELATLGVFDLDWPALILSASKQMNNVFEACKLSMATTHVFLKSIFSESDHLFILVTRLILTLASLLIAHKV